MTRRTCPNCGAALPTKAEMDARASDWRIRVRLYRGDNTTEPVGDSDPELAPDRPGALVVHGLPAAATELQAMAQMYHNETLPDLSDERLRHSLKSLRPTLARNAGRAAWRVNYSTPDECQWLARVDVIREEQPQVQTVNRPKGEPQ